MDEIQPKLKCPVNQNAECDAEGRSSGPIPKFSRFSLVDEKQARKIINNPINKFSAGYGEMPSIVIKQKLKHTSYLINVTLISDSFPEKLKIAKIWPILKKADKTKTNNYRPGAFLCTVSEIYEKVSHSQLSYYLENIF